MENNNAKIDINELKQAIKISELAVHLGIAIDKNKKALCVFHQEKTPSLSFDDEKRIFKCFGCGEKGDCIDLFEKVKGVSKKQAIEYLSKLAGLNNVALLEPKEKKINNSCEIYEALVGFCGKEYKARFDVESFNYLVGEKRGFDESTIQKFKLFCIQDYKKADEFLKNGFSLEDLKNAGLMSENGNLVFYKHKIIVPFFKDGKIIFLQGRRIDDEKPKYFNLKSEIPLFNADALKDMKSGNKIYICEAVFDAMILEQNGYRAVATIGTNGFKAEMADLFRGLDVVLAFDNDKSGEEAMKKIAEFFYEKGQRIKMKKLPDGIKDITEFFNKNNNQLI
jgi:DNA primase